MNVGGVILFSEAALALCAILACVSLAFKAAKESDDKQRLRKWGALWGLEILPDESLDQFKMRVLDAVRDPLGGINPIKPWPRE